MINFFNKSVDKNTQYILSLFQNNLIEQNCKFIGEGANGKVYRYKKFAIKLFKEGAAYSEDHKYLEKLQGSKYFPKLYYYIPNQIIIMEYINMKKVHMKKYPVLTKMSRYFVTHQEFQNQSEELIRFALDRGIIISDILGNTFCTNKKHIILPDVGCFKTIEEMKNDNEKNYMIERAYKRFESLNAVRFH